MSIIRLLRILASQIAPCAGVLMLSLCFPGSSTAQVGGPANRPCTAAGINRSQVLPNVMFDVTLPPFGEVCFVGRYLPLPDDPDHSKIIGFELWRNGTLAYRLPKPDDGLWPPACDSIRSVAFPAHGKFKDVVVIGNCEGASDEQAQPLVYRAGPAGFALDADLSTDLMGVNTVREVERRMRQ